MSIKRDAAVAVLPWRPMAALSLCGAAHFYSICSIFSYAGIMSADLGWASDRDHAGYVAGFLQSSNVMGRIPLALVWGMIAARFGTRFALLVTMGSLCLGSVAFGMCTDLRAAIVSRFLLLGAGNGWPILLGPIAAEVAGPALQTEVIGRVFAAGTFAQLVGPAIGGWLYRSEALFPAMLPSALGSLIAGVAAVVVWIWMPKSSRESSEGKSGAPQPAVGPCGVTCSRAMANVVFLRSASGGLQFMFFEVAPLWAISTIPLGGLALSEDELGIILSFCGLAVAVYQGVCISRATRLLGLRGAVKLSAAVCAVTIAAVPFSPGPISLCIAYAVYSAGATTAVAVSLAFTNNLADVTMPGGRAVAGGVAASWESLGKGLGPIGGSIAFAWPLSQWGSAGRLVVFAVMFVLYVVCGILTEMLPPEVENAGPPPSNELEAAEEPCGQPEKLEASVVGSPAAGETDGLSKGVSCESVGVKDPASFVPAASRPSRKKRGAHTGKALAAAAAPAAEAGELLPNAPPSPQPTRLERLPSAGMM